MFTRVDEFGAPESPPGRRRRWWLRWELALVAGIVLVALPFLGSFSSGLNAEAAAAASAAIEKVSPAEHHNHGHEVTAEDTVICGVHVFGFEPTTASAVAEIETVYGYYFCAVGQPGTRYEDSGRSDGPVVVRLGPHPVVSIAAPGAGYPERVRAMMPDRYESQCFAGLPDHSVAAGVKERFLATVTAS